MSFPRYPKYKDSGVEWLGEVPEHWHISKFRHFFAESPEKIEKDVIGPMLSVSGYRGIEVKEYEDENQRRLEEDLVGYRVVRPGQLVVNTMWLNYAGLGVSEVEGHVSPAYRSYWIDDSVSKRFVHHLMRSEFYVRGYTKFLTGVRPNSLQMSRDDLMVFPIIIPPVSEQAGIASFLDEETAKIDALIEEQRRLIELLKEKRQAVISHAVTKGLDPNVLIFASEIAWLGDIPKHWQIRRILSVSTKITNGFVGPTRDIYVEEGVRYLQSLHIKKGKIIADNAYFVSDEWSNDKRKSILRSGDVLIVQTGDIGQAALVTDEFAGSNCHALIIVSPKHEVILGGWIAHVAESEYGLHTLLSIQTGALHPHLNCGDVKDMSLPVPPLDEQKLILSFLEYEKEKFDALMKSAEASTAILQERRSALISAAVTGKIDVRNYKPQPSAVAEETHEPA